VISTLAGIVREICKELTAISGIAVIRPLTLVVL
jgi:hypothetical protein